SRRARRDCDTDKTPSQTQEPAARKFHHILPIASQQSKSPVVDKSTSSIFIDTPVGSVTHDRRAAASRKPGHQLSSLCARKFPEQGRDAFLPCQVWPHFAANAIVEHARKPSPSILA